MNRKLPCLLGVLLLASVHLADAQQQKKIPQIGVLYFGVSGVPAPPIDGFQQGLRELGYAEGKNVAIVYRFAEGKFDRLPDLAAELVRLKVDVILAAGGTPAILAAKNATSTIPIIFPSVGDPVALGYVTSLARPGGNLTGLTLRTPEFGEKKLEILKEVVPRTKRVAVLGQEANTAHTRGFEELQTPASALGLELHNIEVRGTDFDRAFSNITNTIHATAVIVQAAAVFTDNRRRIAEFAARERVPAISDFKELAEAGLLMSYGSDFFDLGRRAATYVDKILKGAKPADLPVQQPTKFEFVINLNTAKQIGLTIPPNVLARADKVIR
jgi:putative tryptophan/tyrosine transport system substrate-binding protein